MDISRTSVKWILWLLLSILAATWLSYSLLADNTDRTLFMPGVLSDGHHQLADSCEACHTDAFGDGEVLQQACIQCHGEDRVKPFDSHPKAKFKDPRNAGLLENIDALKCVTCHSEHKKEITSKDGLTRPKDICVHCHNDVAKDRESHQGMDFMSCKNSGCHNFHDNRAIYTKYLIKHLEEEDTLQQALMPAREFGSLLEEIADYPRARFPLRNISANENDAQARPGANDAEVVTSSITQWADSAHANTGVNCSACHLSQAEDASETWNDHPEMKACSVCHSNEVKRFQKGKHGMRLGAGLTPMTPEQARLPMKAAASHSELSCNSCHSAHVFDIRQAAVESCLGCHDDEHSLAYKQSRHYQLWQQEIDGKGQAGSGVSCAGCHMPRVAYDISEWMSRTIIDHNQSANLSPNSKMVRSTCQNCHGLEFALDAMADDNLIKNNFNGIPSVHIETMDLAARENKRIQDKNADQDDSGMFGF